MRSTSKPNIYIYVRTDLRSSAAVGRTQNGRRGAKRRRPVSIIRRIIVVTCYCTRFSRAVGKKIAWAPRACVSAAIGARAKQRQYNIVVPTVAFVVDVLLSYATNRAALLARIFSIFFIRSYFVVFRAAWGKRRRAQRRVRT